MTRGFVLGVVPVAVALAVAGCGGSSKPKSTQSSSSPRPATTSAPAAGGVGIDQRTVPGLGPILVNAQGKTLYLFAPDKDKKVTCVGSCATVWPPVMLATGTKAKAGSGVKQSLLGSDPDPSGGRVVTYAGWPLYTYVADSSPGSVSGQGLNLNGGVWYVLSPDGKVINKKP